MTINQNNSRFKSEVRIGLLIFIVILLALNVVSNYSLYQIRQAEGENIRSKFNTVALTVSRNVDKEIIPKNINTYLSDFKIEYDLSSIFLIPSPPSNKDPLSKSRWLLNVMTQLPSDQIPEIVTKLMEGEKKDVTRGKNNEFFYVYPIEAHHNSRLLILSDNNQTLAYSEDASTLIIYISIIVAIAIILVYIFLYRFILSPFKRIKIQAQQAGRNINADDDDVEAMIAEYQSIINELRDKESQLTQLNRFISQKANRLEHFNKYLLESMTTGMVTINNEKDVISLNRAALSLFKLEHENIENLKLSDISILNKELYDSIIAALKDTTGKPYQEYQLVDDFGEELIWGITISTILDDEDQSLGLSLIINDLTEIKQLYRNLERKDRLSALGEMAGGLAHQIRNSLGTISGYINLIIKRDVQPNSSALALKQETTEAKDLIDRFLGFARPLDYNPEPVKIVEFFDQLIEHFKVREECENIEFDLIIGMPESMTIQFDLLLLKQALINIIENAIKSYKEKPGRVIIKVAEVNKHIKIRIQDFGCGINSEDVEKIFTPFYSSRPDGNGLGLPLAKKIISLHNGQVSIKSNLSQGTLFTILLPIETNKSKSDISKRYLPTAKKSLG